jgi:hypothetical protein
MYQQNIIRDKYGVMNSDEVKNIEDSFKKFFIDKVLATITENTNKHVASDEKFIDEHELLAFIDILYMMGTNQDNGSSVIDLWSEINGRPFYKGTMSRNRFLQILKHLRFDDVTTRVERRKTDKFAPMRNVFEMVASTFPSNFKAYQCTTVDEMLSLYRGRCPFKVFMKDKTGKYGILIRNML